VLQALGDLPGARDQFERALAISEAALGPDHPTVRTVRRNLDRSQLTSKARGRGSYRRLKTLKARTLP
jgi:hypothetical protein